MIQHVVILCFACVHLRNDLGLTPPLLDPVPAALVTLGGFVVLWAGAQGAFVMLGRRIDSRGSWRAVRACETLALCARLAGAGWFLFCVLAAGWLDAVRAAIGDLVFADELAALLPPLMLLAAIWWSYEPIDRRVHEALLVRRLDQGGEIHPPVSRARFVWAHARHQVLLVAAPLALVMLWAEGVAHLHDRFFPSRDHAAAAVQFAGVLAIFIASPALMRRIWDSVSMEGSQTAAMVRDMCRQYRVRVRGPYLWRTGGGVINGAILGVLWPFRYMLFSDGLVEHLSFEHLQAVSAHEVAHVRRHHLPWLALSVLATLVASGWVLSLAEHASRRVLPVVLADPPVLDKIEAGLVLVAAGLVFGLVSRRFEWQADAFAAQHLSRAGGADAVTPEAAGAMAATLERVATLNGLSQRRFSYRHGSILCRRRKVLSLAGCPLDALPIDRQVRVIKLLALVVLVVGLGAMFVPGLP